jgi:hypothetical protein
MSDGDSIAQVAVVILLLSLSVPALATAYEYAGTPIAYEEDVTVDYNATVAVSENATVEGYGDDVQVTTDGTGLVRGADFTWDASAGELSFSDTANTSSGDTARVEYRAYQRTEETAMAWTLIAPLMGLFGLFGFIVSARALWQFTAEVWDL